MFNLKEQSRLAQHVLEPPVFVFGHIYSECPLAWPGSNQELSWKETVTVLSPCLSCCPLSSGHLQTLLPEWKLAQHSGRQQILRHTPVHLCTGDQGIL